jgi:periplasmic protein TonB
MKLLRSLVLIMALTIAASYVTHAQDPNQSRAVEKLPVFQGPNNDFLQYIADNLIYPEVAKTVGLQGEVKIEFTVKADGSVTDVKAENDLGGGCDSEAVRVVALSPKWIPAKFNGHAVDAKFDVAVPFFLDKKAINNTVAHLKKSPYGFVFFLGGIVRTLDETEAKFGKTYDPNMIMDIKKYNNPKFAMPDKQGVYLILMRNGL